MTEAASTWTRAPGRSLPGLALAGLPLAVADGGSGLGLIAALTLDAALLGAAAMEATALGRLAPRIERRMDARLVLGEKNEVHLHLHNTSARPLRVTVRDDLPEGWTAEPEEFALDMPAHARRDVRYIVVPSTRGRFAFGNLHLRVEGPLRLGCALVTVQAQEEARVYPNVLGPRRYELAARLGDLRHVGFRNVRRTGGGGEFEQLREYVAGDSYRDVDWKSTAKRRRPVTRVYQQERSQQVILAIDTGRMMATRLGDITKLDHAINAALLLAYVALRQGDRVGLIVFGDVVKTFVPPRRGPPQYRRLLEALYAVEAEATYVDFRRLIEFTRTRIRRRALMVVFSDLLDETQAGPLAEHIAMLRPKHLPLCVAMDDGTTAAMADAHAERPAAVYERAAAADLLAEREAIKARLARSAVQLIETPPGELAVATVNRYLAIKARHRL